MEIEIAGTVLGFTYAVRGEDIDMLMRMVRNSVQLRIKYPDISEEELEEKMQNGI